MSPTKTKTVHLGDMHLAETEGVEPNPDQV